MNTNKENTFYHAIKIDKEICIGCSRCMKQCPTEAIRVFDGIAKINDNKCIDCGECYRVCPVNAIYVDQDDFDIIFNYDYRIALVPAVFIGQFPEEVRTRQIYSCLKELGFTHIYEVEHGVNFMIEAINNYTDKNKDNYPFISSFCPAVIRLIQVRFPSLVGNIIPMKAPLDVASIIINKRLCDAGINSKKIGIFYVTPCAAKIAAVKSPVEKNKSPITGVINMDFLYNKILRMLSNSNQSTNPINHSLSGNDVLWSVAGGEISNFTGRCFAIDGMQNVIDFLEKIENEEIGNAEIIEMKVCEHGCPGGILNSNNRFVTLERLKNRANSIYSINQLNQPPKLNFGKDFDQEIYDLINIPDIEPRSILKLSENIDEALIMADKIKKLDKILPSVDCGVCGAPSCSAFAEDVVKGEDTANSCVFVKKNEKEFVEKMEKIWGKNKIVKL